MAFVWKQTKHEGVRFGEHPARKRGVKPDQYFVIRYRVDGKRREEALGWASQGMTAAKAAQTLGKLQEPARTGEGATSLKEKRRIAQEKRKTEEADRNLAQMQAKVVFHSLRHTFASWLVEQGVDPYTVKELMGHGTIAMTERYSHLSPDRLRRAVKTLESGMDRAKQKRKVVHIGEK